jgi:Peptidase family M28
VRAALLLALVACSAGPPGPGIDADRVLGHVAALTALGPRLGDSAASRRAAAIIERVLDGAGIEVEHVPVGEVEIPAIDVFGTHVRSAQRVTTTDPDLVVHFGPPGRAVLVMAHYDTVAWSPGAVDDAASVGVLIELARVLRDHPPKQPVMLAFTANEERGLVGAEALAHARGDQVELAIALDLVGGSGPLSLNGASTLIGTAELRWLAEAADRAGVVLRAPLPHRVASRVLPQAERADHGAFTRRGIRAFHLYNRGQDGTWIDVAYHGPDDVASRVDRASVDEVGRLLRALVAVPVPPHAGDGFWLPVVANVVVPRWWLVTLEVVLALIALLVLGTLAIGDRDGTSARGAGFAIGCACVAAGLVAAFVVERVAAGGRAAPWLFAPLRDTVAEALVVLGTFGLATRAVARFAPWRGAHRYLAFAIALPLVIGVALVALGAAELAWIWLVPAAALALAPRLGRASIGVIQLALVPCVLVLRPDQLLELAWNGFLPPGVPLVLWLAFLGMPWLAGVAWWWRTRRAPGPLGTLILPVGCGLSVLVGGVLALVDAPSCRTKESMRFPAECTRTSIWP